MRRTSSIPLRFAAVVLFLSSCVGQAALADEKIGNRYPTYVDLQSEGRTIMSLNGPWQFRLDLQDQGKAAEWFRPDVVFDATIAVPGAWQAQGFGRGRLGSGWYKRKVRMPAIPAGRKVWLKIGAVHPACEIWMDGKSVAAIKQPGIPTRFELTGMPKEGGTADITVRVFEENRGLGNWYNLCSSWSGLWRKIELEITRDVWIDDLWIVPDVDRARAVLQVVVANGRTVMEHINVQGEIAPLDAPEPRFASAQKVAVPALGSVTIEVDIPLQNVRLWSPENPYLYRARVRLEKNGEVLDEVSDRFGMRKISVQGDRICLNGKPVYLRGYGDDGYYHRTLCPDTDVERIKKHLRLAKSYGFNVAYPCLVMQPEEYLDAADEVGLLVQYDAAAPLAFQRNGPGALPKGIPEKARLIEEQWRAILRWTQNHPSLVIYRTGSELAAEPILTELYRIAKQKDPTRLVMSWAGSTADQTDVFESDTGLSEPLDPCEQLHRLLQDRKKAVIPQLLHEYAAPESLSPDSEVAEAAARKLGIAHCFPTLIKNSRRIAASTRKLMMEEARKADKFAGLNMWLIQDIPGYPQGLFDRDWEPKEASASEFLKSNGPNVLLMNETSCATRRCFRAGDQVVFELFTALYQGEPIRGGVLRWQLAEQATKTVLAHGEQPGIDATPGVLTRLPSVSITIPDVKQPTAVKFFVSLENKPAVQQNDWTLWLFPKEFPQPQSSRIAFYPASDPKLSKIARLFSAALGPEEDAEIVVAHTLDEKVLEYLEQGRKVFLLQSLRSGIPLVKTSFQSRWPDSAGGQDISATIIDDHMALNEFPHEGFCDYQFYHLITVPNGIIGWGRGEAFDLDCWSPKLKPLIAVFSTQARAGYLFELKVGKGKLLATTLRFADTVGEFPEAGWLFGRLLKYAASDEFHPSTEVDPQEIHNLILKQKKGSGVFND